MVSKIKSEDNVDRFLFYIKGIVYREFISEKSTVIGAFYQCILDHLCKKKLHMLNRTFGNIISLFFFVARQQYSFRNDQHSVLGEKNVSSS